ncbi:MAG: diguanylate cyclase, partial [Arcobacteraceae bacterium]
ASLTTYINYEYKYNEVVKVINKSANENYSKIVAQTETLISNGEYSLSSIQKNEIFLNYLENQDDKKNAISLFLNSINNNKNFFQLRYIDQNGQEIIRVNRNTKQDKVYVTDEEDLQNKADRYYFKETIINSNKLFWYSKFDLNMENHAIEKPYKPTFRISKNIYHKGDFHGMLIVNIDMSKLSKFIKTFANFEISIIDKDGNYLLSSDDTKEWSRYLDKPYNFKLDNPDIISNHKEEYFHIHSMKNIFQNIDELSIILNVNNQFIEQLSNENTVYLYSIAFIIFIASIIIGLLISIPTSKLYMDYNKVYQKNLRYLDTIDKYVLTMDVDTDQKIVHISKALCDLSGYKKEEIIGKTPAIFKSGEIEDPIDKEIWTKINNGFIWNGDFHNITKNKEYFWIHSTILPNYDATNNISSYTAISEDITDKKIIEKLSRTDRLTQICNRMVIDEVLEREFNRFLRNKTIFSVILIDIDKFKLVNDNYGHLIGDQVLVDFSNILKEHSRKTDIVGRWGGEEFMMICIDTEIDGAFQVAEKIRKVTENYNFEVAKKCTISLGISQIQDNDNINSLLKRVDENLYKAKDTGRNKSISDK